MGLKGFQKGNKLACVNKGKKTMPTLLKEQRRAMFDQEISEKWLETINKLKPEYVADQFMGKAPDVFKGEMVIMLEKELADKYKVKTNADNSTKNDSH